MKALNKYISAIIIISIFASCKKEYLDTAPTNSTAPNIVFETTASAALAVNGLAKLMTQQKIGSQGFNGEGTIKMYYGNYAGNHFGVNLPSFAIPINMEFYANPTSTYGYYPWYYYYAIIGNANTIIGRIDGASGPESDRQYIKAQALTFRAYAYTMLAQLYGDRWSSSNNGTTKAVVLRVDESTGDIPLSTLAQTYALIYSDLNTAISLFTSSGKARSATQFYLTDINVAYATYARAALNKQDYATAENFANKAKQSFPLMTVAQYKTGFNTSNSEWIWGSYGATDETLFFYSFQSYIAYNSTASTVTATPRYMSKDLYNKIPATDIRKALFLDPKGLAFNATTGEGSAALTASARAQYPTMAAAARSYPYMQFKFSAIDLPGVGNLNHFRTSEMILIEAEAKYFQNKPATEIQGLLNSLTKTTLRDPSYNCTSTGTALFEEIKTYRAIELWGEGFDFFDLKRWNEKIERKSFANGGNFVNILATTILPTDANNWKIVIPNRESDYNAGLNP
ncbi:RagB/SusD family nutrient uptake outer membrane protein [Pedobacter aquatilis]|uniref:RagB/SusD family nutrient uptake outer membrane protein n=1 Tax=Pedobacter aquatilis TaxID=351343 RepID=UPI0029304EBD|nr:RagB/SusD family nutrient uptake outer membrane protein [Pedobacter aquatilis]